jgi:hypothetical protein
MMMIVSMVMMIVSMVMMIVSMVMMLIIMSGMLMTMNLLTMSTNMTMTMMVMESFKINIHRLQTNTTNKHPYKKPHGSGVFSTIPHGPKI